jgi:class 3 adenylate cyclase/tetratricopeptide (TPR) repeat protein
VTDAAGSIETSAVQPSEVRTFLIADVRGYTRFTLDYGDEAAARLAQSFAQLTEAVVTQRDGRVIELRGDEALAVFSSARQALRAAVELQTRFAQEANDVLPLRVGIGLDAGEAIPVEGGYRGAALNLAARLCTLAGPGEVLASDTVANLARKIEGVEYAERGLMELKGFADRVRVMQVVSGADPVVESEETTAERNTALSSKVEQRLPIGGFLGSLPSGSLVGRNAELARILSAVDAVGGGEGRLIMLAGEPGIGKTRLAQEVTLNLRNRSFLVGAGRCYEPQQAVPFYPFLEALAVIYAAAPSAIRSEAGRRWADLGQLLPEQFASHPAAAPTSPGNQQRLFRAVTAFLQANSEQTPLAILLDDLHWADQSSLDLLLHVARHTRSSPILLLGTYRDIEVGRYHPIERALHDLRRESLLEEIAIRRLDRGGTAALTAATFGEAEVSEEFAELVHRQTEGNPFFTQEVLRALVERGDVFRRDGVWDRRAVADIEVPKSIRSAIGERLSRLDDEVQEVLHEASVLGQTFRFDDLERMSGRDERALEEALEKAAEAGLLREAGRDNYGFNHALTQQTLYAEVSSRRRRRLHLAAGEALEQLLKRARETRPAEVAWHFLEGDDAERALPYAILAGDQAEAVFAHTEAEEHYRTALDLAEGLGDQAKEVDVREKLGGLLTAAIRYPEALEMLERTAQIYHARGDQESEARVVAQVGRVHLAAGSIEVGIDRLQTALQALSEGESSSALAGLNSSLARCLYVRGRYDEALAAAERAIHMTATEAGGVLAESEVTRGAALAMLGQWSAGLEALSEAVDTAERVDDVFSTCRAKQHISCVYLARGEFEAGRQHMKRALTLAERMNNRRQIATTIFGLSVIAFLAGDRDVAQGYAERSLQLIQGLGGFWLPILHATGLSLALAPGQWESASPELKECIDIIEAAGTRSRVSLPGWRQQQLLAARDLEDGRPGGARKQLITMLQDSGMERDQAVPLEQLLAWAYLETGEEAQAADIIRQGLEHAAAETLRLRQADWLRIQAMLLEQQERRPEAQSALDEALSLSRSMPYPYGEARLLYQSGVMRLRRGESDPGREQLAEALAIFQRLGAERDVERARQTLLNARTI